MVSYTVSLAVLTLCWLTVRFVSKYKRRSFVAGIFISYLSPILVFPLVTYIDRRREVAHKSIHEHNAEVRPFLCLAPVLHT